jgi:preprotein translocase subunit SecY
MTRGEHSSAAMAVPVEALSPAEPRPPPPRRGLWFTLAALVIYRLGTYIPIPGINPAALTESFKAQSSGVLGMFNMVSGGAFGRMAIFALNMLPYIIASIIVHLMMMMKKEGEQGRKQINQYARYIAVALAAVQAYGIALGLEGTRGASGPVVIDPGWIFRISTVLTLVGGSVLLMWLGEQITTHGVGNGISLIIMSGIVAGLPGALARLLELSRQGAISWLPLIGQFALMLSVVAAIVFIERSQRLLLVQHPRRHMGNRMFQAHLPLKFNSAGVIPPIFALSLLLLPTTAPQFSHGAGPEWLNALIASLERGQMLHIVVYAALIVLFAFFCTTLVFNPQEMADDLRKNGGFLPGIRPGARTAEYIDYVLTRITAVGAIYLSIVCVLPEIFRLYFDGTALLIVVLVMLELVPAVNRIFRSAGPT